MTRPAVLITRRVPASVVARLDERCDVDLYDGASAIPAAELAARLADKQALMCLLTDRIDAAVLDAGAGPAHRGQHRGRLRQHRSRRRPIPTT